jgi:large subunit ribosomal protein L25
MADIVLNVEVRERTGTGGARDTRRAGLVPGVLYGGDKDPVAVAVKANEFRKALHTGKLLGHLVTLKHGSETQSVIAKAVDMHPVTDEPTHFDLYRVAADQTIKIGVAVHFAHQEASPGLKRGGTLNVVLHEVLVSCHANQIPDEIVVDLSGLEIGDSIRVSDLKLPKGVEAAIDTEATVATVATASVMADADETAEGATEEGGAEAAAEEPAAAAEEGGEE